MRACLLLEALRLSVHILQHSFSGHKTKADALVVHAAHFPLIAVTIGNGDDFISAHAFIIFTVDAYHFNSFAMLIKEGVKLLGLLPVNAIVLRAYLLKLEAPFWGF